MRRARWVLCSILALLGAAAVASAPQEGRWKQVHPHWRDAYVFSFRSPDLLSDQPDEQWGVEDGRLIAGGILSDFPGWLAEHADEVEDARRDGRPILLSIHTHSGFGAGLVTYSRDLQHAEAANYPWLIRQLSAAGLNAPDVTVAVDTCNAQGTAFYQLRPDLQPAMVQAFGDFARWRKANPARMKLTAGTAYRVFTQDHVAAHLGGKGRGQRENVLAERWEPLRPEERRELRVRLYGPRGVILATPTFFNLLRLGPEPRGTLTGNLLTARLKGEQIDGLLAQNKSEFKRFQEFAFFQAAGDEPTQATEPETRRAAAHPDSRDYGDHGIGIDEEPRPPSRPREHSSRFRRD
jgi:hypothetical protein